MTNKQQQSLKMISTHHHRNIFAYTVVITANSCKNFIPLQVDPCRVFGISQVIANFSACLYGWYSSFTISKSSHRLFFASIKHLKHVCISHLPHLYKCECLCIVSLRHKMEIPPLQLIIVWHFSNKLHVTTSRINMLSNT